MHQKQDFDLDYVEWSWVVTIHYLVLYLFINITLIITIITLDILFITSLFYTTFDPLNKFIFEPMKSILP